MQIPRTNNFDLIRLLAASQVVISHTHQLLETRGSPLVDSVLGWLSYFPGVPIFFTVSGFLVFWSFERNADNIGQFFRNRLLRIYPALWVCFAVTVALLLVFREISLSTFGRTDFLAWVLTQVTFLQFYTPDILRNWGSNTPNRSLWTITVELQYYALVPLIYFFLRRFAKRWMVSWGILFLTSVCAYALLRQLDKENMVRKLGGVCVVPYLFNFLLGIALYKCWNRVRFIVERRFLYWLAGYLAFVLVFGKLLGWYSTWPYWPDPIGLLGFAILSTLTISLAFSFPSISERYIKGFDISYGVYIYHALVMNCFMEFGWMYRYYLLPAVLVISYALGSLSWVFVERPSLRLKKMRLRLALLREA